jgi:hypothetical protein
LDWRDFIPVSNFSAFCKHLLSDCCALIVFWVTTKLAATLFPHYDYVIGRLEIIGLILIIGVLLIHLVKSIWKGGSGAPSMVLAA